MSKTVAERLSGVHPQMLRVAGEGDPQSVGKREIGRVVEIALDRACLTKQEAAYAMGYSDAGVMGRWIAGTETPQFAKLWMLGDRFRKELVIALAEKVSDVEVQTTVIVRRIA